MIKSPFDWLITPWDALIKVFQDDGARFGTDFIVTKDRKSVLCGAYNVLYHHEFPRTGDGFIELDDEGKEACRSKLAHKMKTFINACKASSSLLFVRQHIAIPSNFDDHIQPNRHDYEPASADDIDNLVKAIAARFPHLNFRILLVLLEDMEKPIFTNPHISQRIVSRNQNRTHKDWFITDNDWDNILREAPKKNFSGPENNEILFGI